MSLNLLSPSHSHTSFFLSCSQLATPPKLSAYWFGDDERGLATSIGVMFNQIGVAMGYIVAATSVSGPGDVKSAIVGMGITAAVLSALTIIFIRDRPSTPPSASAFHAVDRSLFAQLVDTLRLPSFWVLAITFSLSQGAFWVVSTLLDQIMRPFGYSNSQQDTCGILVLLVLSFFATPFLWLFFSFYFFFLSKSPKRSYSMESCGSTFLISFSFFIFDGPTISSLDTVSMCSFYSWVFQE